MKIKCPATGELHEFMLGKLPIERIDAVSLHLEACEDCRSTAKGLEASSDTLSDIVRQIQLDGHFLAEPECQDALNRMQPGEDVLPAGTQIRDYEIVKTLGRGGMGTVHLARHTKLDRLVAVKTLPPDRAFRADSVARFQREMLAIGRLNHPNIVQAQDAGEFNGTHYLVMELVDGKDVKQVASQSNVMLADACEIVRQAALGLQHIHDHELVHRDIKPSNLLIARDGTVKLADLGLALLREVNSDEEVSTPGNVMGTLQYMAPEQIHDSHAVDIRADIYSLGCVLYRLLAGEQYRGSLNHVKIPTAVEAILKRMLAVEPTKRFQTPNEVAEQLENLAAESDLQGLFTASDGKLNALPLRGKDVSSLRSRVAWGVLVAIGLVAICMLGVPYLIEITHHDGTVTRVTVPENSTVGVKQGDKTLYSTAGTPEARPQLARLKPGLLVMTYPRTREQDGNEGGFVPLDQFTDPLNLPYTVHSLEDWEYPNETNAVASGFLTIDKPGEYAFESTNFYHLNALHLAGREVIRFRHKDRIARVQLEKGLVEIQSVGYVLARGNVRVRWMPPGKKEFLPIPGERLFHEQSSNLNRPVMPTGEDPSPTEISGANPGLRVTTYAKHTLQTKERPFINPGEFGLPLGKPAVASTISPWPFPNDLNAVADGHLWVDRDGEYAFQSSSFDDLNALWISGNLVCAYRDGEHAISRVKLKRGWVPIRSVGFVGSRGGVRVRWMAPGQRVLNPIPPRFLVHVPEK